MNQAVLDWCADSILPEMVTNLSVLEVGSRNVNGSVRDYLSTLNPLEYIGIDIDKGDGVDLVLDANHLVQYFGEGRFDVVVTTEMLEHCYNWQSCLFQMKQVLKPGGWLFLTTRSPGFVRHDWPHDYWRFTRSILRKALSDMDEVSAQDDPSAYGVFIKGRRTDTVVEVVGRAENIDPPSTRNHASASTGPSTWRPGG